jgi:hypothetical protein
MLHNIVALQSDVAALISAHAENASAQNVFNIKVAEELTKLCEISDARYVQYLELKDFKRFIDEYHPSLVGDYATWKKTKERLA